MDLNLRQALIAGDVCMNLTLTTDDLRELLQDMWRQCRADMEEERVRGDESPMMTRAQVREYLHIGDTKLHALQREGRLAVHKLGGKNLYRRDEVMAMVAAQRRKETPAERRARQRKELAKLERERRMMLRSDLNPTRRDIGNTTI